MNPAVDGALAKRALESAAEIAGAIAAVAREPMSCELGSGSAGLALTFAYLDELWGDRGYGDLADQLLEASNESLGQETLSFALFGGFTGAVWVNEHVAGAGPDEPDPCVAVDEALAALLATELWPGQYDLIQGLVGMATYALERKHRPTARALLTRIVDHLELLHEPADRGITWLTPPALVPDWQLELAPDGYYNLGLAHGVPGIVAVLARIAGAGIDVERARRLLAGGVEWVLGAAGPPELEARYDQWLGAKNDRCIGKARSGWCYGDLGPAVALYAAGVSGDESRWVDAALEIARGVAARPADNAGATDACLCHGTGSLVQFFTRFYRATGERWAAEATAAWVERTLAMREAGGLAGYQYKVPAGGEGTVWAPHHGFLGGAAGTALALVAAATSAECDWDRLLLFDLPD